MKPEIQALSLKIAQHLTTQRAQAMGLDGCVYRAGDGKSCAVGCLIDEDLYHVWMEGRSVSNSRELMEAIGASQDVDITRPPLYGEALRVLTAWQRYHDSDVLGLTEYYRGWLDGEARAISPDDFHELLLKEFP